MNNNNFLSPQKNDGKNKHCTMPRRSALKQRRAYANLN
nr:MAG TPA: hypothetical protein [Caudoviricetes sp.]